MADEKKSAPYEKELEEAYCSFDSFRKDYGMPMVERDAFKAAVRAFAYGIEADFRQQQDETHVKWYRVYCYAYAKLANAEEVVAPSNTQTDVYVCWALAAHHEAIGQAPVTKQQLVNLVKQQLGL